MKYEDFKAVCKWLQTEQVSLDLNEDEIKQEYSLFEDSNKEKQLQKLTEQAQELGLGYDNQHNCLQQLIQTKHDC